MVHEEQTMNETIIEIKGWRFAAVFILLGLMFLFTVCGVLAIIIGVVDIWPRIEIMQTGKWKGIP
jgi:hypothetical protein